MDELVIDPFLGSGSVGIAALALSRRFMGNDLSEEAIRISKVRLFDQIATNGNGSHRRKS